jgi:hypothetical protein
MDEEFQKVFWPSENFDTDEFENDFLVFVKF